INKADVTPVFSNTGPFVYSGGPHAPTYALNGVNSEVLTLSATVSYTGAQFDSTPYGPSGTAPTNEGNYTQKVDFSGNNNYNPLSPSATQAFMINKANATISVTPYNVAYYYNAHTATGTATGVEAPTPADLTSLLHLTGTTHTLPGDY